MYFQVQQLMKKCHDEIFLILDLDGILLKRYKRDPGFSGVMKVGKAWIKLRCGWLCFLKKILSLFRVGIWSSMEYKELLHIHTFMEDEAHQKIPFFMIWSEENCYHHENILRPDNSNQIASFKPLYYVYRHFYPHLHCHNTVLVDVSTYKCCMNSAINCIFPDTYHGCSEEDYLNGEILPYLEEMREASNIQEFIKNNCIGQKAITSSHKLYSYLEPVMQATWNSDITTPPPKKQRFDDELYHAKMKGKKYQSIHEELDADQVQIVASYSREPRRPLTRGEAIVTAIHLGIDKKRYSESQARDHINFLISRMERERGLMYE